MSYQPKPIDTSYVTLTTEHLKITELLAKNTHELWSTQRLGEGWEYGPQRDDGKKQHPGLVPYEDLPESEKEYDRVISVGVIKTLLALGYRIETGGMESQPTAAIDNSNLSLIMESLKNSSQLNLSSLQQIRRETINIQPPMPDIYRVLGESILNWGEPLMAYDILAEGLRNWPNDVRLQQLTALALARSGAAHRANAMLLQLVARQGLDSGSDVAWASRQEEMGSGNDDGETISLLARTEKDLWQQASDRDTANRHLALAAERYKQAYKSSGSYYPGINAATMKLILGEREEARAIAAEVREKCLQELPPGKLTGSEYWLLATLGEAALILGDRSGAEDWYSQAVELGRGQFGQLSSTRRNATSILQHVGGDLDAIKKWFQIPRVVVFSGHIIDTPDRSTPRFPAELESKVYEAIRDRLVKLDARLGYASAACGSDILFLEAMAELGGELHIVLPYEREQFIKESVDLIPGGNWRERFEILMARATETIVPAHYNLGEESNVIYEYANRVLYGLAKMRSEHLDTELVPLAVWNGKPGGVGGTAAAVEYWRQWHKEVEIVDLESLLNSRASSAAIDLEQSAISSLPPESEERSIMALLFGDVKGYSKLKENQISPFVRYFFGGVAELEAKSAYKPVAKNTWGDALYYVFASVRDAGLFGLELCDFMQSTDWTKVGLPEDFNLRIGLHAGPVYRYTNPITNAVGYGGTHVSHAARIEPIAPPGKVYGSREFAAIASSEGVEEFACDYVGQTPLAKGYGTFPTYHVRRRGVS